MFFDIFKKNSFAQLESFYIEQTHNDISQKYPWMALAVNLRTISNSVLTKELVFTDHYEKNRTSFQLAEIDSGLINHIFIEKKKIYSGEITDLLEIKNTRVLFNNLLDNFIENEIKFLTAAMNSSDFSPRQLETEEKALEWLRVSFEVLTKAVLESLTNPDYLFQSTFFAGINPKTKMREMRLITFNLDMTFLLLPDNNLRILIYNKRPQDEAELENLKPALMGDYSFRKREMFDHFIQLLSIMAKGMHSS